MKVDTRTKEYEIVENASDMEISDNASDFLAPDLFDALLIGMKSKCYKKI